MHYHSSSMVLQIPFWALECKKSHVNVRSSWVRMWSLHASTHFPWNLCVGTQLESEKTSPHLDFCILEFDENLKVYCPCKFIAWFEVTQIRSKKNDPKWFPRSWERAIYIHRSRRILLFLMTCLIGLIVLKALEARMGWWIIVGSLGQVYGP